MQPYIGITGFTSRTEVESVLHSMPNDSNRLLMVGVLASLKTLRSKENNWKNRYPKVEEIRKIFSNHHRALNLIHYNTKDESFLSDQLFWLHDIGGPHLHGFQLNMAWPSPVHLAAYRKRYPNSTLVLQVGGKAMKEVDYHPGMLLENVRTYRRLVNYVLLDPSGGLGRPFDPEEIKKFLIRLCEEDLNLSYGTAGGLSPTTLDSLRELLNVYPQLSWDAEGRLRDEQDNLVIKTSIEYVQQSCRLTEVVR